LTGERQLITFGIMNALSRYADTVYCIMRLIVGLLFACHGGQKILGFPPGGHGMPPGAMGAIGAWVELAGGFLVAFGFLTRIAAFLAAGEMAVAYFMAHAKGGAFPIQNHGEPAVVYCFVFLFIFFYGPGRWSIDAMMRRGTSSRASTPATV
jgi:putative oxidoreductase